jgi:hypothetical protein
MPEFSGLDVIKLLKKEGVIEYILTRLARVRFKELKGKRSVPGEETTRG